MTLEDLARSDECPHLRRLAGETLPSSLILKAERLVQEASGGADDSFLDPVPLKKVVGTVDLSDGQQSSIKEEVNGLCETETARTGDIRSIVTEQMCSDDLSSTAALMSPRVQTPSTDPQTGLADSITDDGSHCSAVTPSDAASGDIVTSVVFNHPAYKTPSFPTASELKTEMMTCLSQDACMSYVSDNYHVTGLGQNGLWLADQQPGTAVTASDLLSLTSCMQAPYGIGSFSSILSTANVNFTPSSVHSSTTGIIHRSSDVLHGCPQDMNLTDYGVTANQWPNGVVASPSESSVNGISRVMSVPADNDVMYFGQNLIANAVPALVPPVPAMNPLASSSPTVVPSSVAAAGGIAADLSYISLDDVSAVLRANGFSDKTSSPSASDVLPENHTIDSQIGENHTSDVNQTGIYTTVNETPAAVTRVCIFCQKPCKSER